MSECIDIGLVSEPKWKEKKVVAVRACRSPFFVYNAICDGNSL